MRTSCWLRASLAMFLLSTLTLVAACGDMAQQALKEGTLTTLGNQTVTVLVVIQLIGGVVADVVRNLPF